MRTLSWVHVIFLNLLLVLVCHAAEPQWETPLGGRWTAADGTAHLFRHGRLKGDKFIVRDDKDLRKPDSTTDRTTVPAGTELAAPGAIEIRSEGKRFHLLFWNDSDSGDFSVLAVFPDGSAEPSDVVDVKADRETYLSAPISVGPEDIFTVTHAHLSAGEDHNQEDAYRLRDGRLSLVASAYASSSAGCPAYREELRWKTRPVAGLSLAAVVVSIELVVNPKDNPLADDDCKRKEWRRHFEDTYQWNPVKRHYVPSGGNLSELSKWEKKLDKQAQAWAKKALDDGR